MSQTIAIPTPAEERNCNMPRQMSNLGSARGISAAIVGNKSRPRSSTQQGAALGKPIQFKTNDKENRKPGVATSQKFNNGAMKG